MEAKILTSHKNEVKDLIDAHFQLMGDEDLLELTISASEGEEAPDLEEKEVEMGLALERLSKLLRTSKKL